MKSNEKFIQYQVVDFRHPFFHTISYELHFPFSYELYEKEPGYQVSFFHEYYHLLQATTTVQGIYKFTGISERFVYFLHALQGKQKIWVPLTKWAEICNDDKPLKEFQSYEIHFNEQELVSNGNWRAERETGNEFDIVKLPVPLKTRKLERLHITRRVKGSLGAMPILRDLLSEAQAECCSTYLVGIKSDLFDCLIKEQNWDLCLYNTIPGYISKTLPDWPQPQTIFFLTEFALMSYAMDEAFAQATNYLKTEKTRPPIEKDEWASLWKELCDKLPMVNRSLKDLRNVINKKLELWQRHKNNNPVANWFIYRLEKANEILNMRDDDPLFMFPWERSKDCFLRKVFPFVPVPHAFFEDKIKTFGTNEINDDLIRGQSLGTGIQHLMDVFEGKKGENHCPYYSDKETCPFPRTYECKVSPWANDQVIDGKKCPLGFLGKSLRIDKAEIKNINA